MIIEILLAALLIAGVATLIYLIISLRKLNTVTDDIRRDLEQVNRKLVPLLDNLEKISEKALNVSEKVERHAAEAESYINGVKSRLNEVGDKFSQYKSDNPVNRIITTISALGKGISTFWNTLRNNL